MMGDMHTVTLNVELQERFTVDYDNPHLNVYVDPTITDTYDEALTAGIKVLATHPQIRRFRIHKWYERVDHAELAAE